MKLFYRYLLCLMIPLPGWPSLWAQTQDTVELKPVHISSTRSFLFAGGPFVSLTDTLLSTQQENLSVAALMESRTTAFVKSYGSGGAATLSARGTEARQNSVLWHGFNLNSPSMGLTDLSLIPALSGDMITWHKGGSSPVNGNAAMGSTLVIESLPATFTKQNKFSLGLEAGSFGRLQGSVGNRFSNRWIQSRTSVYYSRANNDFTFTNTAMREKPSQEQAHASTLSYGILQEFQVRLHTHHVLGAGIWYQFAGREIPPLMTVPESFAEQRDSTIRTYVSYKYMRNRSVILVKAGWFREYMFYDDFRIPLNQRYLFNNYFGEAEWRFRFNDRWDFNTGVSANSGVASFDEYQQVRQRNTWSVFSNLRYQLSRGWNATLSLRQEVASTATPPFSPSLAIDGFLFKKQLLVHIRAGRHYSLPTLNDLYWKPGGNPELLPENAWSEEAGLVLFPKHRYMPALSVTSYHSQIDNWITWQQGAGGIYTPGNVREVRTLGLESELRFSRWIKTLFVSASAGYAWCQSTIVRTDAPGESQLIGKQLMYVPEHIFTASVTVRFFTFTGNYTHRYMGERFTTADNSHRIEGYPVADVSIEKKFHSNRLPLSMYVKAMNLYNTSYQVMAFRPMPGRWFSIGIHIDLILPEQSNLNPAK